MNKLNNSFKVFFDNVVKPFVKKENSRNYKMEFADGSSNLFKTSIIKSYKNNYYNSVDCNYKIMNENKTLLEGKLNNSNLEWLNIENNYKKIREMDNSFNYGYNFSVNNLFISYDYWSPKTTIQVVDNDYNVVINRLEIPDISLIKYIGNTGSAGYGMSDFDYLAFEARQKIDGTDTYQTKIVFLRRDKLISYNPENITQAFEERKEYVITNENLGETYSNYYFDSDFSMRGNYIPTSYAHGVLYILRGIYCRTGTTTYGPKKRRLVAIVVDFALNDDRTDVNMSISERVLEEIPEYDEYGYPLVAISNTEVYYSDNVVKVSVFLGKKIYVSRMQSTHNSLTQTTEVPTFTEYDARDNSGKIIEGNFSGIADFGYNNGIVYYLIIDSAQNAYKYTTSDSVSLTLIKKADEVKKYLPYEGFGLGNISSFNVGNDTYVMAGGYISKDLCAWFPFRRMKGFINGKYIENRSIYECNNIDKLLAIRATRNNDIKAKVVGEQNYAEITEKYNVFYTQHSVSNFNSINFVLEDNNKYCINNNNY